MWGFCRSGLRLQQGGYLGAGADAGRMRWRLIEEAVAAGECGGPHLLLIEAVPDEVTAEIVKQVECPVLGCGAGASADGHVVVLNDMLGYSARVPRFVEKLADVPGVIAEATGRYVEMVRDRSYPGVRHQYRKG